jgi:hypothetical protein
MMDRFLAFVRRHPVKTFALSGAAISATYRSRQKQMEMKKKRKVRLEAQLKLIMVNKLT